MVGGMVIEASESLKRPDVIWVNCQDPHYRQTCAIMVEKNATSMRIEIGDSIWWQGREAMWTPAANRMTTEEAIERNLKQGADWDIVIPRVGYSGVQHPDRLAVSEDICPKCGGSLDTGWECNNCGFDSKPLAT